MIKTGRNDPCLCGSGKKYKKCCLDNNHIKAYEESLPFEDYFVNLPPVWGKKNSKSTEIMDDYKYESKPDRMRSKHTSYGDLSKNRTKISQEQEKIIDD